MFEKTSRYANVARLASAGFPGTRPRPISTTPGLIEHRLAHGDRLDRLAAHYYGDPRLWWRILDANPEILCGADLDMRKCAGEVIVIPADAPAGERR